MFKKLSLLILIITTSCAVVPKESVELSATVGRDIVKVYEAHKELSNLLFSKMKEDVNSFVDEVYAPYQIGLLLAADYNDAQSGNYKSLTGSLINAAKNSSDSERQKTALNLMNDFVLFIKDDVESYRRTLLALIEAQEKEIALAIDRSYNQIIYANSIVTGHLSSVRKVHDAQEEILNQFGVENLRTQTSQKLSNYSKEIGKILTQARKVDKSKIEQSTEDVLTKFNQLFKK